MMAPLALVWVALMSGHLPELSTVFYGAAALAGIVIVNRHYRRSLAAELES